MAKPITINRDTPPQKSMDYYFLKKEGIRLAQQYSGAIWTDYNDHDPGITLLEYLCYAITDLGYRTNFKIEDLLYAKTADNTAAASNAFFSPAAILPCAPLSTLDYRRLLIDHFDAIKNVWIGPAKDSLYKGLFDIKLQLNDEFNSQAPQTIIADVLDFMAANRNLTEDINAVTILQTEYLDIKGEIALELDASEELVLAQILYQVESFLNPKVQYHTQQELSLKGYDYCMIFDGPKPEYGFILPDFLPPLTTAIYISEIRELLLKIPGVQAIHFLEIQLNSKSSNRDEIAVPPDTIIVLNPALKTTSDIFSIAKSYPIQFYKGDFQVMTNLDRVIQMYQAIAMKERQLFQMKVNLDDIVPLSRKRLEDIGVYYSFQRYLPHVYGLGEFGVPQNADSLRKAQAKQLKGYLLIFEQFLSSYLAQLTHVRDLFSIGITEAEERIKEAEQEDETIAKKQEESPQQSYFVQFPNDVPDLDPLIRVSGEGDKLDLAQAKLTELVRKFDQVQNRKNRFLDHLLARFGESFQSDFLQKIHELEETEGITETLIAAKTSFLQDYIKLSKYRGRGFNYRKESWEASDNVSGFKKRICALMNIEKAQDRSLLPHQYWNLGELEVKRGNKAGEKIALPFLQMLSHGIDEGNYQINKIEKDLHQLFFCVPASEDKERLVFESKEESACQNLKVKLIDQLKTINKEGKGFFLLEHVLLRPLKPKGWKLRFHIQADDEEEKLDIAFESFRYDTLDSMKSISDSLLLIASNPSNFDCLLADKKWFIVIKDNGKPILVTKANFKTEAAAKMETKKIVALIKQKKDGNEMENWETFNNWIDFKPEPGQGFQLSSDFYSYRISIIIPNWIKSFQQQDIRSFFEGLVGEQLPAHILVDFHWMNVHQLTEFETTYKDWLAVKSGSTPDKRELDDLSIKLSGILAVEDEHKKLIATLRAKKTTDQLPKAIEDALFVKYRYSIYFREDDLQIIEGIGEVIERTLKQSGINSWAKIVVRGENIIGEKLRQHLGDKTYQIHRAKIKSWIKQAELATKANWEELIKLQKELNSPPGGGKKGTSPAKIEVLALTRKNSGILIV